MPLLIGNQTLRSSSSTSASPSTPLMRTPRLATAATRRRGTGLKHATVVARLDLDSSGGTLLGATARPRSGSAAANGHAARRPEHVARRARRSAAAARGAPRRGAARSAAGRACTGAAACAKSCSASPVSTNMPGVHHVDALAHAGDDAEVVRDQDQRGVVLDDELAQQRRGSAPGSSRRARSSARRRSGASARRRAPSRSSRAGACRPRTGAGSRSSRAFGLGIPTWSSSSAARASAALRSRPKCVSSASRICRPIVSTGFRLVIGSWKIIAISRPRISRSSGRSSCEQVAALEARACRSVTRPARGRMPSSASEVTLLPQPDSPTIPSVSPGAIVERDAVDGVDRAAVGPELDAQVVDRRGAAQTRPRSFGSSASRRPSPIRLKPSTEMHDRDAGEDREERRASGGSGRVASASSPTPASTDPAGRARGSRGRRRR